MTPVAFSDMTGWATDVLTLQIGSIGTTAITLGAVMAFTLIIGAVLFLVKRVKGRG